jgi:SOS-response transcriptional repressor LexA
VHELTFEEIIEKLNFASKSSFNRLLHYSKRKDCIERYTELKEAMGKNFIRDELSMNDLI